jgi:hypothetical protein
MITRNHLRAMQYARLIDRKASPIRFEPAKALPAQSAKRHIPNASLAFKSAASLMRVRTQGYAPLVAYTPHGLGRVTLPVSSDLSKAALTDLARGTRLMK